LKLQAWYVFLVWCLAAKWRRSMLWISPGSYQQFSNTSVLPGLYVWAIIWWIRCYFGCPAIYG